MKRTLLSLLFLSGITSLSISAQTQLSGADDGIGYTLEECIDYALDHNIALRQAELAIENSLVGLNQSKANVLPSANGQFGLNSNFGRNIDPFSNDIVTQSISTNSMGVGANMLLYNGYRLKNTIARSTLDLEASRMDLAAQRNNISLQIAVAYLNVISSKEMINVAEKNIEVTRLQLERTQKMVEAGSLAETNLFNLNAQLANDELSLVNSQNQFETSILTLKQAMNLTDNRRFDVGKINVPEPDLQLYPESPQQVYEAAINYLPEIKAAEIREEMALKNIQIAKAVGLPSVSANVSWGTAFSTAAKNLVPNGFDTQTVSATTVFDGQTVPFTIDFQQPAFTQENIPYFSQLGNNQSMNAGISMQIPIFNGFNKKYQMQSAKIQQMQSELTTENTLLGIRQNIDQAYINMQNAAKAYSANLVQVDALQKAFVAAESSYNAGASNFVDYNLAKTNLDRAQANLIQAKYDYIFRIKILDFYQNKPLEL
ncbi:TolC family protein [Jiulongibacter sp. NS-SX5]|uniref:TolC family protein n=1 Tax=Jiulongibacter sp. NS-SX5 TaxID=3463854 RepID=UPI0040590FC7